MQQELPAPQALVQLSHKFETSRMGERRQKIRPGSMGDICFQLLGLRAAIKTSEITDPKTILETATGVDRYLETWRAVLQSSCSYATADVGDVPAGTHVGEKRHIFSSLWTTKSWNNWRTLRILVNQIVLQNEIRLGALDSAHESTSLSLIHQLSTEICISAASFRGSPRRHPSTPEL
jgi:hypothetical protein